MKLTKETLKAIIKEELENMDEERTRARGGYREGVLRTTIDLLDDHMQNPRKPLSPQLLKSLARVIDKIRRDEEEGRGKVVGEWENRLGQWGYDYMLSGEKEDLQTKMNMKLSRLVRDGMADLLEGE